MSTLKNSLENNWHNQMYKRYIFTDPSNRFRKFVPPSGLNYPPTIDSAHNIHIERKRYADGVAAYNVGFIPPRTGNLNAFQHCTNETGNPYRCANIPE